MRTTFLALIFASTSSFGEPASWCSQLFQVRTSPITINFALYKYDIPVPEGKSTFVNTPKLDRKHATQYDYTLSFNGKSVIVITKLKGKVIEVLRFDGELTDYFDRSEPRLYHFRSPSFYLSRNFSIMPFNLPFLEIYKEAPKLNKSATSEVFAIGSMLSFGKVEQGKQNRYVATYVHKLAGNNGKDDLSLRMDFDDRPTEIVTMLNWFETSNIWLPRTQVFDRVSYGKEKTGSIQRHQILEYELLDAAAVPLREDQYSVENFADPGTSLQNETIATRFDPSAGGLDSQLSKEAKEVAAAKNLSRPKVNYLELALAILASLGIAGAAVVVLKRRK